MYKINEVINVSINNGDEWRILSSEKEVYPVENNDLVHSLFIRAYSSPHTFAIEKELNEGIKLDSLDMKVYYGEVLVYEISFRKLKVISIKEVLEEGSLPITTINFQFEENETQVYKDLASIVKSEF